LLLVFDVYTVKTPYMRTTPVISPPSAPPPPPPPHVIPPPGSGFPFYTGHEGTFRIYQTFFSTPFLHPRSPDQPSTFSHSLLYCYPHPAPALRSTSTPDRPSPSPPSVYLDHDSSATPSPRALFPRFLFRFSWLSPPQLI